MNRKYGADMKSLRVLVVEDDAVVGMLLGEMLVELGHSVCAIGTTVADAVAAALRFRPELMIVDAWLGGGSGVCAVDEILRSGYVPHVFVSGDALRVLTLKPEAIVLQKPFREAELIRAIQRSLGVGGLLEPEHLPEHLTGVTSNLGLKAPPRIL